MRETRFKNETIRECTECGGTGKVIAQEGWSEICPVCEGTGMVKRTAEGTVRYESYRPESNQHIV